MDSGYCFAWSGSPQGDPGASGLRQRAFATWDERASVRHSPSQTLIASDAALDMYPREMVAHVAHPLIVQRFPEAIRPLLTHALYRYLEFTTNLELHVVNATTLRLISARGPVRLANSELLDAHRLMCDESYHALFCTDLARQVRSLTGCDPVSTRAPAFLGRLHQRQKDDTEGLQSFLFTAASEMLITDHLLEARRYVATPEAVRGVFTDHAADEYRHRIFFGDLLTRLLREAGRDAERMAAMIPQMLVEFLAPDTDCIMQELFAVGIPKHLAAQIVDETYAPTGPAPFRKACAPVLALLDELELSARPAVQDQLTMAGLIVV